MYVAVNESSTACSPASKARNASRLEVEVAAAEERRRRRVGVLQQQPGGVAGRVADLRRVVARLRDARRVGEAGAAVAVPEDVGELLRQRRQRVGQLAGADGDDVDVLAGEVAQLGLRRRRVDVVDDDRLGEAVLLGQLGDAVDHRLVVAAVVAGPRRRHADDDVPSPLVSRFTGSAAVPAGGRLGRRRVGRRLGRGRRRRACRPVARCRRVRSARSCAAAAASCRWLFMQFPLCVPGLMVRPFRRRSYDAAGVAGQCRR